MEDLHRLIRRRWARALLAAASVLARVEGIVFKPRRLSERLLLALEQDVRRLQAENDLLRRRLRRLPGRRRPRYRPWERLRILWHWKRYRLSLRRTAKTFVVSKGTLLRWLEALKRPGQRLLAGRRLVRRLPDLVHEVAALLRFDQPEWGTRRIAHVLARLGLKVSRTSVQRILRKRRPSRPRPVPAKVVRHVRVGIRPRGPHHVWFMDLTTVKGLFGLLTVHVGAVIDAFSRSVLSVAVHPTEPTAKWVCQLLQKATVNSGSRPGHLVTDHGAQFAADRMTQYLRRRGIRHRYGAVQSPRSLGIIERFWRSMKGEVATTWLLVRGLRYFETKLLRWAVWFNIHRPHQGIVGQAPVEMIRPRRRSPPIHDVDQGRWLLVCEHFRGERSLPVYSLRCTA